MTQIAASALPISLLFERAADALSKADAGAANQVLADCSSAVPPASPEEFSRALAQQAALEGILEHTVKNLRFLRGEESSAYGRTRRRNAQ